MNIYFLNDNKSNNQAQNRTYRMARDTYYIYRKKKDGSWLNVGKIKYNPMAGGLPFKVKYYPLIYSSKEKIEDKL